MNRDEMLNFLKNEARGISVMFGPNCETIVHDMTRPGHPILAIFNGTVTGREVGSTADIFGDIGDYDESIYQNKDYINQMVLSRDGRTLKSSTFNIVGEDYHFALGINPVSYTHLDVYKRQTWPSCTAVRWWKWLRRRRSSPIASFPIRIPRG